MFGILDRAKAAYHSNGSAMSGRAIQCVLHEAVGPNIWALVASSKKVLVGSGSEPNLVSLGDDHLLRATLCGVSEPWLPCLGQGISVKGYSLLSIVAGIAVRLICDASNEIFSAIAGGRD